MKPQNIANQIGQLNREILARQEQVRELQKEFNQLRQEDLARIKKSVIYKVTKVETAPRERMKALGAIVLVLTTNDTQLTVNVQQHVETFGAVESADLPKREIRSLVYYYAGGRIWHESGGHHIIAKEPNDPWGDKGVPATQEQWDMIKIGKVPAELVGEYVTISE